MNLCSNLSRSSCVKGDRQGLLVVHSPSGGGLGWGRLIGTAKSLIATISPSPLRLAQDSPNLSLKGEGELKDPERDWG